jgi:ferredoxin-NADP reductase
MLRHHAAIESLVPVRALYSARSVDEIIYREELVRATADVRFTLTRAQPDGWQGYRGRIDATMLADVSWPASERPIVYVCGPTGFVETAAGVLVALGHEPARIRTERFGPT